MYDGIVHRNVNNIIHRIYKILISFVHHNVYNVTYYVYTHIIDNFPSYLVITKFFLQ